MSFDILIESGTYELENDVATVTIYREIFFDRFEEEESLKDTS
ncbi:MAG: hypothetical protein ACOCU6_01785 [Nanoarchaeota archaeon]